MTANQCRQADVWDWTAQLLTIAVKIGLENKAKAEQQKPAEERDLGVQIKLELGKYACDWFTREINKDLCVPIVKS